MNKLDELLLDAKLIAAEIKNCPYEGSICPYHEVDDEFCCECLKEKISMLKARLHELEHPKNFN